MSYRTRTVYLILGQVVSAIGIVGMVQANIGLDPWNCLHQGLSNISGLSFGICTILVGSCAIFISFLLKEPLSLGTVVNVLCPGLLIDLIQRFHLIPRMNGLWSGIAMMLAVAATVCQEPIYLEDYPCVRKSYPGFFRDFTALGGKADEWTMG